MPSAARRSRFGVRIAMTPWLYAPILAQPMSSPMIMMMLGFCWAAAGPAAQASATRMAAKVRTTKASRIVRRHLISCLLTSQIKLIALGDVTLWASTPSPAGWSPPTLVRAPMPRFSCSMLLLLPLQDYVRGVHAVELALHLVPRNLEIAGEPCRIDQVHVVPTQEDRHRA